LVFSRGRLPNNLTFTFNEMEIGIVSEFNYLGVLLSKSGNFSMAKKAHQCLGDIYLVPHKPCNLVWKF
jgi:hypothetical protein